jgi:uncharacterized protein (TIGR03382 family)
MALCLGGTATAAEPGIVIDLTDVRLSLIDSRTGIEQPIEPVKTWAAAEWGLSTELRTGDRIENHSAYQQHADYTPNLPAHIGATLTNGAAFAGMTAMFGDIHLATALGPYPEEHVAIASGGWNTQFNLPAHTQLTMSGHVNIHTNGEPVNPYANFSSRFDSEVYFLPSVVVDLQRATQADLDFTLTANNPFDTDAVYFHSTGLYATSVALAAPIPEPPAAAMLAAGVLLGGWQMRRRKNGKGPQPLSM